jgi:serine/threonine protein kinase
MKKFFLILFLLALITTVAFGFFEYNRSKDKTILTLIDGSMIVVDSTSEAGGIFFYEVDDQEYMLDKNEVKSVGKADYRYFINRIKKKATDILSKTFAILKAACGATTASMKQTYPIVVVIAGAALLCIIVLFIVRLFVIREKKPLLAKPEPVSNEAIDDEINRMDIVRYFLNIFKLQIDAPPETPSKITPLSSKSSGPNYIYELSINDHDGWVKRRITIGLLGEDTGSKSRCFYVIYDVHLVVKIPTRPIVDFEDYIESINKEGHIVDKLAPKECVIPKVSVILDLIDKLPQSDQSSAEKSEERYISWLRKNPAFQANLKIKNSFIFFMDFSKFYFLGHIIDNLHDLEDSIPSEIIENPETIWEASKFKGRYGKRYESVFYEIREVYTICEAKIRQYLEDSGEGTAIPLYRIQSWFLTHLAGKEVVAKESGISEKLVPGLNHLIRTVLSSNEAAVGSYRKTIKEYAYKIHLEQNKPQMSGIITNLLDLLAWLREKQVSMRDLKPDNLLVAGDPSKYPRFLMSADEYSLGIIDVETALDFEKSKYRKTQQPLLGGTPFYATPSHFFVNQTLQHCFRNFRKILHYQDWHAMVVMIFKVVTGDLLFDQTAKLFGYIKEKIRYADPDTDHQVEIVKEVSKTFWKSASTEFAMKMGDKEEALKSVQTKLPENVKRMFLKLVANDQKTTIEKMKKCIDAQASFQGGKSRELLLKSSHAKIVLFKNHLKKKFKSAPNPPANCSKVVEFLDDLIQLKLYSDQQKQAAVLINKPKPAISAYDLLTIMFSAVYHTMFNEEWQIENEEDTCTSEPLDDEATTLEAYP